MPILAFAVPYSGKFLVSAEAPRKAEAVLVLAGDYGGNRLLKAAELVKQGWAPVALVSGPGKSYDRNEADLAVEFATNRGWPKSYFEPVPHVAHSTQEEAVNMLAYMRKKGIKRFLLVTSDFHTRRAGRIYRRMAPEAEIHVVAAPTPDYEPGGWWRSRQSRKTWLYEWEKMIADYLGGM